MPIDLSQENDFSWRQLALNSHLLPCDKLKIQIQRGLKFVNLGRFFLYDIIFCLL
jgi:hypothetical protein